MGFTDQRVEGKSNHSKECGIFIEARLSLNLVGFREILDMFEYLFYNMQICNHLKKIRITSHANYKILQYTFPNFKQRVSAGEGVQSTETI